MSKNLTLTQEDFDNLLRWFSVDRNEAGEKYEEIRSGLIRFFRIRGCSDPLALADDTLNRVASKIPKNQTERENIPIKYIYGFAINVYHENIRMNSKKEIQLDVSLPMKEVELLNVTEIERHDLSCLEQCLAKMSPDEKRLMLNYYSKDKSSKFEFRRQMADELNITIKNLHTKVHRLKNNLKKCIENCLIEKNL